MQEKNPSRLLGTDRKIRPSGSLFGITRQSLVMPTVTPDGFLHLHPTLMKDSYNIKRSFQTDWSGRTVLTQIRLGSSLIKVSTVRHSICIILINNFIENPYLSNLRVINAFFFFFFFFLSVRIFRIFPALDKGIETYKDLHFSENRRQDIFALCN